MSNPVLFNVTTPFEVRIISGGDRLLECRYPTDAEWIAIADTAVVRRRKVGTDTKIESQRPSSAELELLQRIANECKPDQPDLKDFDEFDAQVALERLQYAKPGEVVISEGSKLYTVTMAVFGNREVSITLRSPRQRQLAAYNESALDVRFNEAGSTTRINVRAAATLFDELFLSANGYEPNTAIPITHKDEAIGALIKKTSPEV